MQVTPGRNLWQNHGGGRGGHQRRTAAGLPPRVAADFVLRYHHGYNNREIARLEGVSERTVGARLAQARDELSRRLGPGWLGELPTSETAGVHFPRERSGVRDA